MTDFEFPSWATWLTEEELVERMLKVLDLHHEYRGVCTHCVDPSGRYERESWPCKTVRTLTGEADV